MIEWQFINIPKKPNDNKEPYSKPNKADKKYCFIDLETKDMEEIQ